MKSCPKCGKSIKDSVSFCPFCGTKVSLSCTACGAPLKPGAKFCQTCGAKVAGTGPKVELRKAPVSDMTKTPASSDDETVFMGAAGSDADTGGTSGPAAGADVRTAGTSAPSDDETVFMGAAGSDADTGGTSGPAAGADVRAAGTSAPSDDETVFMGAAGSDADTGGTSGPAAGADVRAAGTSAPSDVRTGGTPVPSDVRTGGTSGPAADDTVFMSPASSQPPMVQNGPAMMTAVVPDGPANDTYPADQSAIPAEVQDLTETEQKPSGANKRRRAVLIAVPVLAVVLAGLIFGWRWYSNQALARELMDEAGQYMEDGKYRQAQGRYQELLELQPKNAEAVTGLARAFLFQEKFPEAEECLETLQLSEGSEHYETWQRLLAIAQFDPELAEVNTEHFPQMELTLRGGGDLQPVKEEITITEDGQPYEVSECTAGEGEVSLSYLAPDTDYSNEERSVSVSLDLDGIVLTRSEIYYTPTFEPAQVRLVSADVSKYPLVTAYFRVEDSGRMAIEGLDAASFRISERLQGGEFLSREVHSAEPLKGNQGLSIDLVADKSSSISDMDMQKIKRVMTDFTNSLHYEEGDKAEILAFDSIVQQMCYYTNDSALLSNGINNMATDGMTALYNAIHDGIHNAALQGGARCVIAFTDGMDNESRYSPSEIIRYANDNQVPVYIIGVGRDVEAYTLRSVAEGTGGRYWFIDDLYDLQEIFNEIYAEQKKLYAVEYTSDESLDAYASRDLEVTVNGGGYRGKEQTQFQAVRSVSGETHASRYELVKGALSWEDAAKRCQEMGGHLATITSQSEMDTITKMADAEGLRYIWLGGYTSYDSMGNVFGHWVTGENFDFQPWSPGEPSRVDLDGVDEWYIMLWNIQSLGGWTWNDQRNDPVSVIPTMAESMGFICEYES